MTRIDGRHFDQMRKVRIKKDILKFAEGSCLIEMGNTQVMCAASVEGSVPPFLRGKGKGWVTSEYGMLPRSCRERIAREGTRGRPNGRTQEIQRLIGRSLRSVVDMGLLGERSIWIDCDVIQGDGGTRTASITGSFVALSLAMKKLQKEGILTKSPIKDYLAAVSVGILDGVLMADLNYEEDSKAGVDMNVVMTGSGRLVEVQGTAEADPFTKKQMNQMLDLAAQTIQKLIQLQKQAVRI
ncbi:MAG: ribonuclease PH [Candidatus Omnitrophica bacterium]|nr:ribonuclease PH [Candidatus Omnitrophota bacterium]